MKTSEAKAKVYLDIETSSGERPDPLSIKAPSNYTKPEAIEKYQNANVDKEWRKQSLDPHKGEVYCIGLAVNDMEPICLCGNDEEDTMNQFEGWLSKQPFASYYGHNIIEFDGYWLFIKGLKYGLKNVVSVFANKFNLKDTMLCMDGPAWKKMTSLDKMAKVFGVEGKGGVDGSMVHDMILNGKGKEVCDYCISDVDILRNCAKELSKYGLI